MKTRIPLSRHQKMVLSILIRPINLCGITGTELHEKIQHGSAWVVTEYLLSNLIKLELIMKCENENEYQITIKGVVELIKIEQNAN
jgi:hypothetical protein